jgi:hypothetical protein
VFHHSIVSLHPHPGTPFYLAAGLLLLALLLAFGTQRTHRDEGVNAAVSEAAIVAP